MDCLFCKIANKETETKLVFENGNVSAFNDINPEAPVHILIVPKKHIESVKEITEDDKGLVGEIFLAAKEIAKQNGLEGYKLEINVGREGGQIIGHLHVHLLGKK